MPKIQSRLALKPQDSLIFKNIMEWEKGKFASYGTDMKQKYLGGLKARVAALKREKDLIPVSQTNENKIWRFNADITQLNWRYRYLSATIPKQRSDAQSTALSETTKQLAN